jgi:hypothetical protein
VSIPVSNLGGFLIGFLLALVGGAMAVSWVPGQPPQAEPPVEGQGSGDAPEGVVPGVPAPDATVPQPRDGVEGGGPSQAFKALGENDLSGTSPANGANGRHSAG